MVMVNSTFDNRPPHLNNQHWESGQTAQ